MRRVALAGYMGAGKTTVGQALAALWTVPVIDLDAELVTAWGPIAEQFAQHGEAVFRARESQMLQRILDSQPGDLILTLGGGAMMATVNRRALAQAKVSTVYLRMPLWLGWSRIHHDAARPLASGDFGAYRERFARRRRIYGLCDYCVDVYPGTAGRLAARIDRRVPRCVISAAK